MKAKYIRVKAMNDATIITDGRRDMKTMFDDITEMMLNTNGSSIHPYKDWYSKYGFIPVDAVLNDGDMVPCRYVDYADHTIKMAALSSEYILGLDLDVEAGSLKNIFLPMISVNVFNDDGSQAEVLQSAKDYASTVFHRTGGTLGPNIESQGITTTIPYIHFIFWNEGVTLIRELYNIDRSHPNPESIEPGCTYLFGAGLSGSGLELPYTYYDSWYTYDTDERLFREITQPSDPTGFSYDPTFNYMESIDLQVVVTYSDGEEEIHSLSDKKWGDYKYGTVYIKPKTVTSFILRTQVQFGGPTSNYRTVSTFSIRKPIFIKVDSFKNNLEYKVPSLGYMSMNIKTRETDVTTGAIPYYVTMHLNNPAVNDGNSGLTDGYFGNTTYNWLDADGFRTMTESSEVITTYTDISGNVVDLTKFNLPTLYKKTYNFKFDFSKTSTNAYMVADAVNNGRSRDIHNYNTVTVDDIRPYLPETTIYGSFEEDDSYMSNFYLYKDSSGKISILQNNDAMMHVNFDAFEVADTLGVKLLDIMSGDIPIDIELDFEVYINNVLYEGDAFYMVIEPRTFQGNPMTYPFEATYIYPNWGSDTNAVVADPKNRNFIIGNIVLPNMSANDSGLTRSMKRCKRGPGNRWYLRQRLTQDKYDPRESVFGYSVRLEGMENDGTYNTSTDVIEIRDFSVAFVYNKIGDKIDTPIKVKGGTDHVDGFNIGTHTPVFNPSDVCENVHVRVYNNGLNDNLTHTRITRLDGDDPNWVSSENLTDDAQFMSIGERLLSKSVSLKAGDVLYFRNYSFNPDDMMNPYFMNGTLGAHNMNNAFHSMLLYPGVSVKVSDADGTILAESKFSFVYTATADITVNVEVFHTLMMNMSLYRDSLNLGTFLLLIMSGSPATKEVILELDEATDVTDITYEFLRDQPGLMNMRKYFDIDLSLDNKHWINVIKERGSISYANYTAFTDNSIHNLDFSGDNLGLDDVVGSFTARYIKILPCTTPTFPRLVLSNKYRERMYQMYGHNNLYMDQALGEIYMNDYYGGTTFDPNSSFALLLSSLQVLTSTGAPLDYVIDSSLTQDMSVWIEEDTTEETMLSVATEIIRNDVDLYTEVDFVQSGDDPQLVLDLGSIKSFDNINVIQNFGGTSYIIAKEALIDVIAYGGIYLKSLHKDVYDELMVKNGYVPGVDTNYIHESTSVISPFRILISSDGISWTQIINQNLDTIKNTMLERTAYDSFINVSTNASN